MQNSHEIREFVWLYDRIDIMESWTEELENKLIVLSYRTVSAIFCTVADDSERNAASTACLSSPWEQSVLFC